MTDAPMCPLCKIREREWDSEPGRYGGGYYSTCGTCSGLTRYRGHNHTHYPSPVQVSAGTYVAGASWRTAVLVRPVWEDGVHVGFRCDEFDVCGWEYPFTAAEREVCERHTEFPDHPVIKGVCFQSREHRVERGECDERGYITEYGRRMVLEREDAANWDPGRYVSR